MRRALPLLIGLLPLLGALPAGGAGWAGSLDEVRQASAAVKSVQARFVQTKAMRLLTRPLRSEGVFAFQSPGSVRWEYARPLRSVLVLDGERLQRFAWRDGAWQADAAERLEAMRIVVEEMQAWLTGRFADSRAFAPELVPASAAGPARVVLTPREDGLRKILQRVELSLGERPGLIERIEIVEGPEATTTIDFLDIRLDEPVPAARFQAPGRDPAP
jgi:outer membrane lipoprotein-sorting protein